MALFTLILEFGGGTYCSQHEAHSPKQAIEFWVGALESTGADWLTAAKSIESSELTPLSGMKNVWCGSGVVGESLALLNIIQTETEVV